MDCAPLSQLVQLTYLTSLYALYHLSNLGLSSVLPSSELGQPKVGIIYLQPHSTLSCAPVSYQGYCEGHRVS